LWEQAPPGKFQEQESTIQNLKNVRSYLVKKNLLSFLPEVTLMLQTEQLELENLQLIDSDVHQSSQIEVKDQSHSSQNIQLVTFLHSAGQGRESIDSHLFSPIPKTAFGN
jgi:hypothetical protein